MKLFATIRHVPTGEERTVDAGDYQPDRDGLDVLEYLWGEGNYACDCNRALFFYDWGPESDNRECGDSEFFVVALKDENGNVIYADDPITEDAE